MDNHKRIRVNLLTNSLDLRQLRQLCHYEKHLAPLVGKSALAMEIGNATANHLNNLFRNLMVLIADNDNIFLIVKANGEGITGLGHYEESKQCVQHRFNTKESYAGSQKHQVKNKTCGADADGIVLLNNRANNIRTTAGAAYSLHTGSANTVEYTTGDTR